MGYKIAVVGATGNVGREFLKILDQRRFPVDEIVALASERSKGKKVSFGEDHVLTVEPLSDYDFRGTDIALFSPGSKISSQFAPIAAQSGCVVIDNTSFFRMDQDVPLIVPEVNAQAIAGYTRKNIIANPNCSTIQLVTALKPLHDAVPIKRVVVATYQSVSGAGKSAMDELYSQTKGLYMNEPPKNEVLTKRIAFNVIPHIDVFMPDGRTKEEWKMDVETQKILDPSIRVSATCARVPVFIGHSEAVHIEFLDEMNAQTARKILQKAPGIQVIDQQDDGGYITPVECSGEDAVFVSRIRNDDSTQYGLSLWIVSDNLRKGAALNAIQIAEYLVDEYL